MHGEPTPPQRAPRGPPDAGPSLRARTEASGDGETAVGLRTAAEGPRSIPTDAMTFMHDPRYIEQRSAPPVCLDLPLPKFAMPEQARYQHPLSRGAPSASSKVESWLYGRSMADAPPAPSSRSRRTRSHGDRLEQLCLEHDLSDSDSDPMGGVARPSADRGLWATRSEPGAVGHELQLGSDLSEEQLYSVYQDSLSSLSTNDGVRSLDDGVHSPDDSVAHNPGEVVERSNEGGVSPLADFPPLDYEDILDPGFDRGSPGDVGDGPPVAADSEKSTARVEETGAGDVGDGPPVAADSEKSTARVEEIGAGDVGDGPPVAADSEKSTARVEEIGQDETKRNDAPCETDPKNAPIEAELVNTRADALNSSSSGSMGGCTDSKDRRKKKGGKSTTKARTRRSSRGAASEEASNSPAPPGQTDVLPLAEQPEKETDESTRVNGGKEKKHAGSKKKKKKKRKNVSSEVVETDEESVPSTKQGPAGSSKVGNEETRTGPTQIESEANSGGRNSEEVRLPREQSRRPGSVFCTPQKGLPLGSNGENSIVTPFTSPAESEAMIALLALRETASSEPEPSLRRTRAEHTPSGETTSVVSQEKERLLSQQPDDGAFSRRPSSSTGTLRRRSKRLVDGKSQSEAPAGSEHNVGKSTIGTEAALSEGDAVHTKRDPLSKTGTVRQKQKSRRRAKGSESPQRAQEKQEGIANASENKTEEADLAGTKMRKTDSTPMGRTGVDMSQSATLVDLLSQGGCNPLGEPSDQAVQRSESFDSAKQDSTVDEAKITEGAREGVHVKTADCPQNRAAVTAFPGNANAGDVPGDANPDIGSKGAGSVSESAEETSGEPGEKTSKGSPPVVVQYRTEVDWSSESTGTGLSPADLSVYSLPLGVADTDLAKAEDGLDEAGDRPKAKRRPRRRSDASRASGSDTAKATSGRGKNARGTEAASQSAAPSLPLPTGTLVASSSSAVTGSAPIAVAFAAASSTPLSPTSSLSVPPGFSMLDMTTPSTISFSPPSRLQRDCSSISSIESECVQSHAEALLRQAAAHKNVNQAKPASPPDQGMSL